MGAPIKAVIADIDAQERDSRDLHPMQDIYMLPVPMATYKALSDAAARKNLTFAQLLSRAFAKALEE